MTETQKKIQEAKMNKRAEALRKNLRKRKIQQQARQDMLDEPLHLTEDPSLNPLSDKNATNQLVFYNIK